MDASFIIGCHPSHLHMLRQGANAAGDYLLPHLECLCHAMRNTNSETTIVKHSCRQRCVRHQLEMDVEVERIP